MSERLADQLRHFCWLQSQLPASTVGGRWGFPRPTPSHWLTVKVRAGIDRFGGRQKRRLALSRVSQVRSTAAKLPWQAAALLGFPLFYLFGMLKNLTDYSRTSGVIHWQGSESGSGAPPDLAGLLESACAEEERPWEIIPTTWLHLCVPLGRCDVRQASWQLAEVVPRQWHHQWAEFLCQTRSYLHYHKRLGPGWDAQGTRKCPLVKVRVSLVGTWSPSRFFNHDSAGRLWCINNTPCVSEWDVNAVLRGGLALNQTK